MGRTQQSPEGLNTVAADRGAGAWADHLLATLGVRVGGPASTADEHPALLAQRVGLHALIGERDGPPQVCPVPLAACAQGALAALARLAPAAALRGLDGAALLTERAAIAGLARNGATSPGGACRLLPVADGWLAVSLPRAADWELLPAWLETDVPRQWPALAARLGKRRCAALVERGRLLGLAVAADAFSRTPVPVWRIVQGASLCLPTGGARSARPPRVVDLSALWAGPLCARLLACCGAEVIKVEALGRPDGARRGCADFYALMNGGKASVALDFTTPTGREQLRTLLAGADIIIESARPRALRQLGMHAEEIVAGPRRPTWIAISGHGRDPEHENAAAYGDDAGVAAGLSRLMFEAGGGHWIVGDAIADPLTGIHAALAAWASWRSGGGRLVSLALSDVARACAQFDLPRDAAGLRRRRAEWTLKVSRSGVAPEHRQRTIPADVAELGADTRRVLAGWR